MRQDRSDVLFLTASSLNFVNRRLIVELAAQSRLPITSDWKECTEAGGLMSYGYSRTASFHRAAIYVGKILNGAKPGDLPVEQPTKYELVINLNAEKVLGLTVPPSLIARADQIIE
jgi:putative ABC transport system substrate-binding protein